MMNWKLRPAVAGDAAALKNCIDAAYAAASLRIDDLPAVSDGIEDDIGANNVWVAELDRMIVGGVVLILMDSHGLIANVAVAPTAAGLGLGRGLIEHAESACRNLGLTEIRLSTHVLMPENVRFYRHLGWSETSRSGNKVYMTKGL